MRRGDPRLGTEIIQVFFFSTLLYFTNHFKLVRITCKQLFCLARRYWNFREHLPMFQVLAHRFLNEGKVGVRNLFLSKIYVVIKSVVYRRPQSKFRVFVVFQNSLRQKMGKRVADISEALIFSHEIYSSIIGFFCISSQLVMEGEGLSRQETGQQDYGIWFRREEVGELSSMA